MVPSLYELKGPWHRTLAADLRRHGGRIYCGLTVTSFDAPLQLPCSREHFLI